MNLLFVIRKQAQQAKIEAEKEGIVVPTTISEYCLKPKVNPAQEPQVCHFLSSHQSSVFNSLPSYIFQLDMTDFYDDYDYDEANDTESDEEEESHLDGDDSGNAEQNNNDIFSPGATL